MHRREATRPGEGTAPNPPPPRARKAPRWTVFTEHCFQRGSKPSSSPHNRIETCRRLHALAPTAARRPLTSQPRCSNCSTAVCAASKNGSAEPSAPSRHTHRRPRPLVPTTSTSRRRPRAATTEHQGTYGQPAAARASRAGRDGCATAHQPTEGAVASRAGQGEIVHFGGEFVVFDNLLHDSIFPARYGMHPPPSPSPSAHDRSTSGEVLIAQQLSLNRRVVCDLASWLEACNTYISVLVAHYPARVLELLATSALFAIPARVSPPTAGCGTTPAVVPSPLRPPAHRVCSTLTPQTTCTQGV